jgi:hypothetical protein
MNIRMHYLTGVEEEYSHKDKLKNKTRWKESHKAKRRIKKRQKEELAKRRINRIPFG